jgi:hypothetical protein
VITFAFIPDKLAFAAADLAYSAPDNAGLLRYLERQLPFASFVDLSETLSLDDYYRTDPHWRQEQLLPAAQQLSEALGIADPLSNDWQAITLDRPFYGAYYGQSALPLQPDRLVYLTSPATEAATVRHAATGDVTPVYDLEKAAGKDPYDLFLSGASPLLILTSPQADTEPDLFVFRDSLAAVYSLLLRDIGPSPCRFRYISVISWLSISPSGIRISCFATFVVTERRRNAALSTSRDTPAMKTIMLTDSYDIRGTAFQRKGCGRRTFPCRKLNQTNRPGASCRPIIIKRSNGPCSRALISSTAISVRNWAI